MTVTVERSVELPAGADRVWVAMCDLATFRYVTRGLFGWPALAGRTQPVVEGESGTGWLLLFHVLPLYRHTIRVDRVDPAARTIATTEHGGALRSWRHTLHVEPLGPGRSRYTDRVEIDAGPLTPLVAGLARGIYAYRHRR